MIECVYQYSFDGIMRPLILGRVTNIDGVFEDIDPEESFAID